MHYLNSMMPHLHTISENVYSLNVIKVWRWYLLVKMFTRLTCSVLLRVKVLGADLGLKLNVLFRSREEDLVLFQCCRLNPNFRLERSGADIQTSSQEISFQLCIPIWLEGFSAVYFMMMIFFFFLPFPSLPPSSVWNLLLVINFLALICEACGVCMSDWSGGWSYFQDNATVCLDAVSQLNKRSIYIDRTLRDFFSFCLFVWSHLCSFCLQGHETHGLFFLFQSGERRFIQPPSFWFFWIICQWELGCEPLTHMGDKTNGPGFGSNASDSQFTL